MRPGFHATPVLVHGIATDCHFNVPRRYTNLRFISGGTQGIVVSADDEVTGTTVAIKQLSKPFPTLEHARRTFREILLLSSVNHPNIVQCISVFSPQESEDTFQDIYIVMELMTLSMNTIIKSLILDHKTVSYFIYQILRAVNHLHEGNILHRDLKPANIAVQEKQSTVKLLDFGLARICDENMTKYTVTRYYRAPEVVLQSLVDDAELTHMPYSVKADIWSVGCIFAELITGDILFKGSDRVDQWIKIIEKMGTPTEEFIELLNPQISNCVRRFPVISPKLIEEFITFQVDPENKPGVMWAEDSSRGWTSFNARQLLSKMIEIDPSKRYSTAEALQHPYMSSWYRSEEVHPPISNDVHARILQAEALELDELKSRIFEEVKLLESNRNIFQ